LAENTATSSPATASVRVSGRKSRRAAYWLGAARSLAATIAIAVVLTFAVEFVARGSFADTVLFFVEPYRPMLATVALFTLLLVALDGLFGRAHIGVLILAPFVLALAATGWQKSYYLGDPLYPTDFLYGRQILELLPLLARERVGTAILIVLIFAVLAVVVPMAWMGWRRRGRHIRMSDRLIRVAIALPLIGLYASILDYSTFSWTRDRLKISPIMWDQKANYSHNGFTLAFALNVPMAKVAAPEGYSPEAIRTIGAKPLGQVSLPANRPDIIMVMSESFWDPTRLPGVTLTPDPLQSLRPLMSGHVFSPEFGGMTANVEFEALTGFSNAFLPYGSIPYQQYIRNSAPTLASFLRSEGYETQAMHPFEGWFWNRAEVYKAFGFEDFRSVENLPAMETRGTLVSDAALTDQIIARAERAEDPLFLFAVTLQSHGPYEPGRYAEESIKVGGQMDAWTRGSIATFSEGMADADKSFQRLIEWAEKRERPTVIAFFGDHLPPLGPAFVGTGFLPDNVAPRSGTATEMKRVRETPLVVWSNRKGVAEDIGTVSPAFMPLLVLRQAGITHPYYTGLLGQLHDRYPVVDRHLLIDADGRGVRDWSRATRIDPMISDVRMLQYDTLFGDKHGERSLFPKRSGMGPLIAGPQVPSTLPYGRNPV
jgi:phosphoglycerol transferase MdoB-like AlkP superfamily enzyme